MKNITKIFAAVAASLLAFSCTPQFPVASKGDLPQISSITPVVTVDQETNYVTFSIKETGVVPMWIFGEEKVDGKTAKYSYTGNGISLRVRDAGEHTIELKVYNKSGVSQDSKEVTFSLENTYRDPFDPAPYMKALASAQWTWDADNDGHFGCGPNFADPLSWWGAKAHEKDGFGLYDDVLTFTDGGKFIHNPGEGGTIYVNWESGFKPEGHEEEIAAKTDYQAEVDETSCNYTIENNWNDAGVEEIFLVLEPGQYLSYIPLAEALTTNTRYQFASTKPADIKKNPVLIWSNAGIAWKYSFVSYVHKASPLELLCGPDSNGKVWVMDFDAPGHLGCGPNVDDPTSWWSASPGDKSDTGLFDNEYTFHADGKYDFNVGPDGVTYVNKDFTATGQEPAGEDYDLAWESFSSTFEFIDDELITLPEGIILGYIPNNAAYETPHYVVKELTETKLVLVCDSDPGIAWQYIFKARDIVAPSETINGVAFQGGKAELSFTQGAAVTVEGIELTYIDPDFFEGEAGSMKFAAESGDYRVYNLDGFLKVIPMSGSDPATYGDNGSLWIIGDGIQKPDTGTAPSWNTDPVKDIPFAKDGNTYQVTVYVTGPNFKVFGQPNWGMELGGDSYTVVEANDYFKINGFPSGADSDNGNIWSGDAFETGWYVIKLVANGDGTFQFYADKKKETYYDIEGETNLYRKATITPEIWYTGADWSGGLTPEYEIGENNDFTATMPAGIGGEEWKGQNKLHTGVATSSDKIYDFCCTLEADEDCVVTIKLTGNPEGDGDPHAFFYDGNVILEAGVPLTYQKAKISQPNSNDDFTVIFDYGRVPAGKTVKATQICFQEHLEK